VGIADNVERTNAPIRNAYWVVEGALLAGEYPGAVTEEEARAKLGAILDAGIRSFVDLMEPDELRTYQRWLAETAAERRIDVRYRRMSVIDGTVPTIDHMRAILTHIDAEISASRPVYVHCWGGIGRTGTVVGCWLVERGTSAACDVVETIAVLRRGTASRRWASPERPGQVEFIANWTPRSSG